jgi:hypothetical protein
MPTAIPPRPTRGHAASGARVFVGGVAFSATLALAGMMAMHRSGVHAVATAVVPTSPVAINGPRAAPTSATAALRRKTATTVRPKPRTIATGTAPRRSNSAITQPAASSVPPTGPQLPAAAPGTTAPTVRTTVAPTTTPATAPPTTVPPTTPSTAPPTTISHAS